MRVASSLSGVVTRGGAAREASSGRVAHVQLTWTLDRLTWYAREGRGIRGRRVAVISIVVAVLAVACGPAEQAAPDPGLEAQGDDQDAAGEEPPHPGPTAPEEGPLDPDAEIRPEAMEIHPAQASPGENVELH